MVADQVEAEVKNLQTPALREPRGKHLRPGVAQAVGPQHDALKHLAPGKDLKKHGDTTVADVVPFQLDGLEQPEMPDSGGQVRGLLVTPVKVTEHEQFCRGRYFAEGQPVEVLQHWEVGGVRQPLGSELLAKELWHPRWLLPCAAAPLELNPLRQRLALDCPAQVQQQAPRPAFAGQELADGALEVRPATLGVGRNRHRVPLRLWSCGIFGRRACCRWPREEPLLGLLMSIPHAGGHQALCEGCCLVLASRLLEEATVIEEYCKVHSRPQVAQAPLDDVADDLQLLAVGVRVLMGQPAVRDGNHLMRSPLASFRLILECICMQLLCIPCSLCGQVLPARQSTSAPAESH
mmetsp:Transcript_34124/g.98248  ORF Transcript_34124/g.98248 Transcript_34124/m.98248 type:complete len:349 (+) Transcript_34124:275-1321(+)